MDLWIALPNFADPGVWISLVTLSFLEIVLGIDNLIFISIVAGKLPAHQQARARNLGIGLAMGFRILLLLGITWIISLTRPVITLPAFFSPDPHPLPLSVKDLILIAGGLFLIVKSTLEIHHKLRESDPEPNKARLAVHSFSQVIIQILLIDAVFSFDSILTAVGLVDNVLIMIIAVVISMGIMMAFAGPVTRIIQRHPSLQMLALAFLVVIGVVLIASGLHQEISKSIIYSCLAFSLSVEFLNIKARGRESSVPLQGSEQPASSPPSSDPSKNVQDQK